MAEDAKKISIFKKIADFFRGVKVEYSKIIFPNRETLKKQTTAVLICAVILGLLIFGIDLLLKYLLGFIL